METQRYYRDVLGFTIDWLWEGNYGAVFRDEAAFFFRTDPTPITPACHILHVGDVNALHAEWTQSGDGQQFFYIMDVAVYPDHQGRGIGTALMNEVVAYLQRATPPKALIGLFTGANRNGFYERFGFRGPDTGLYGMSAWSLHFAAA